ncbi:MAG TPA: ribosome biogenesis factor YjgA [Thiolinea sp.]|nr:ribosome biogenesis factor YjgA [Thiolinea sp.]
MAGYYHPIDEDDDYVSRSHDKREAEAVQAVGEKLIELRPEQLAELDLPESLVDAILEAKRLTSHGALRRQKQYIGKLMRQVELEPIQAKFAEWEFSSRAHLAVFHRLERWRDQLLVDDAALGELLEAYPQLDMQHIRGLIRNARKEQTANKPPKSSRELFQYLRSLAEA